MRFFHLVILLIVAFALRIYQLDSVPLRGDEAYNAVHWTKTPFSPAWLELIEYEPNPGALVIYWAWSELTGVSPFALRYLPVLVNTLSVAVGLALAHRLTGSWRLAALVGVLWAVNPFFIWHAQDARQYALLIALTPLTFYLLLRMLRNPHHRWLYIIFQTLTIYTYYIELFWLAAQGLYVLSLRRRDLLLRAFRAWLVIGVLLLPLFVQVYTVLFVRAYEGTAASAEVGALFTYFVPTLLFGENRLPLLAGLLIAVFIISGIVRESRYRWLLLAWLAVPLVALTLVSTQTNLFLPRYVVTVTPVLLIGIVLAVGRYRALALLVTAGMVAVSLVEVRDYFTVDPPKAADWPGLVAYLNARTTADDVLISDSIDPALEYYYDGPAHILFIPEDNPPPDDFMPDVLAEYQAVYVLSGERTGEVGQYLQANAQPVPGDTWPGVVQYRPWEVDTGEIQTPLDVEFEGVASLRGYTLLADSTLILYWEALSQTAEDYSVLLHLYADANAPPTAVLDHAIAGAVVSTRTWEPGALYRDPVALPVPPDSYDFHIGLYPAGNPNEIQNLFRQRLEIQNN